MSVADQPIKPISHGVAWRRILPSLTVFAAAFALFALVWPAMSPGVRASISLDLCLPQTSTELSPSEIDLIKSVVAGQVSAQLTEQNFDQLIQQTQQTGKVVSSSIEYFDRETIAENIELGFTFQPGKSQLHIDYVCQGHDDQLRLLQLLGQRVAASIDDLVLSPNHGIVVGGQINREKFDRAIWLANQIQSDLNQIREEHNGSTSYHQNANNNKSRYSFASATNAPNDQATGNRPITADALNSIDANSLSGLLTEIKSETISPARERQHFERA